MFLTYNQLQSMTVAANNHNDMEVKECNELINDLKQVLT